MAVDRAVSIFAGFMIMASLALTGLSAMVRERCPSVFAAQPVFVTAPQMQRMAQVVRAVDGGVAALSRAGAGRRPRSGRA